MDASAILSAAVKVGLAIRLRGIDLRVVGLDVLPSGEAAKWRDRIRAAKSAIVDFLGGNDDPAVTVLRGFGVTAAYVEDNQKAKSMVASLVDATGNDGLIGLDIETKPTDAEAAATEMLVAAIAARELKLRETGKYNSIDPELAELRSALEHAAAAPLHPDRGEIRLVQAYAGGDQVSVFDLDHVDLDVLEPLWSQRLVIHNASFELKFLQAIGIEPRDFHCTLQMAGLLAGVDRRSLAEASAYFLGLDIQNKKALQTSDWSAPNLSGPQLNYAALDAVLAFHLATVLMPQLKVERVDNAYRIQLAVLPAVARMERRGVGFDRDAHATLIDELKERRLELESRFEVACDEAGQPELASNGVPSSPAGKEKLLGALLTHEEWEAWPVTPKGTSKSTRRSELRRAAHYAPIAVLAEVGIVDKRLQAFGPALASFTSNGRIHASYNVAQAITGRASCSSPNVQQTPAKGEGKQFRSLYTAAPGHVLVGGDWSAMELRAAAHISGDVAMTDAFAAGLDLHRLTAASFTGLAPEDVSDGERNAAKAVNFGAVYGMGPDGLVQTAWNNYGMRLEISEAKQRLDAFAADYPQLAEGRRRHANVCRARGYVRIGAKADKDEGRIHRFAWNAAPKPGERDRRQFSYTQSCNLPVQGACADASMLALALIDKALPEFGIVGGPVIWCHDEIVLEVREEDAERAETLLKQTMTRTFDRVFPGAPLTGLVSVHSGRNWGETK